ncbi:MAG: pre-peptidase C-terminal domain-containing protein [Tissierellales bacterium]|jgi:hypothetical protein|nr:pre-peptidase C-terminal domain-containing protein [Tissierellales bacterium]
MYVTKNKRILSFLLAITICFNILFSTNFEPAKASSESWINPILKIYSLLIPNIDQEWSEERLAQLNLNNIKRNIGPVRLYALLKLEYGIDYKLSAYESYEEESLKLLKTWNTSGFGADDYLYLSNAISLLTALNSSDLITKSEIKAPPLPTPGIETLLANIKGNWEDGSRYWLAFKKDGVTYIPKLSRFRYRDKLYPNYYKGTLADFPNSKAYFGIGRENTLLDGFYIITSHSAIYKDYEYCSDLNFGPTGTPWVYDQITKTYNPDFKFGCIRQNGNEEINLNNYGEISWSNAPDVDSNVELFEFNNNYCSFFDINRSNYIEFSKQKQTINLPLLKIDNNLKLYIADENETVGSLKFNSTSAHEINWEYLPHSASNINSTSGRINIMTDAWNQNNIIDILEINGNCNVSPIDPSIPISPHLSNSDNSSNNTDENEDNDENSDEDNDENENSDEDTDENENSIVSDNNENFDQSQNILSFNLDDSTKQNSISDNIHSSIDNDYYKFDLTSFAKLKININNDSTSVFKLYNENQEQITFTSEPNDSFSSIEKILPEGQYYIKVFNKSVSDDVDKYALSIESNWPTAEEIFASEGDGPISSVLDYSDDGKVFKLNCPETQTILKYKWNVRTAAEVESMLRATFENRKDKSLDNNWIAKSADIKFDRLMKESMTWTVEERQEYFDFNRNLLSIVVGFTPVDTGYDLFSWVIGKDLISGEDVELWCIVLVFTPEIIDASIKTVKTGAKIGIKNSKKLATATIGERQIKTLPETVSDFFAKVFSKATKMDLIFKKLFDKNGNLIKSKLKDLHDEVKKRCYSLDELKELTVKLKDHNSPSFNGLKGDIGEVISDLTHQEKFKDYVSLGNIHINGNQGFDAVYVKYIEKDNKKIIESLKIVEVKFGSASLGTIERDGEKIKQMSDDWIKIVIDKMESNSDESIKKAATTINSAMDNNCLEKVLSSVSKETGDVSYKTITETITETIP